MKLARSVRGVDGKPTLGTMTSHDGKFSCVTLERSANGDHPCISASAYAMGYAMHHGKYRCPEVMNVPGRTAIHIHVANCCAELLGCIAVGENVSAEGDAIEHSQSAFDRLMEYLDGVAAWTLEIIDPLSGAA
jgi:Family of unknown function (DUF5675)